MMAGPRTKGGPSQERSGYFHKINEDACSLEDRYNALYLIWDTAHPGHCRGQSGLLGRSIAQKRTLQLMRLCGGLQDTVVTQEADCTTSLKAREGKR